MSNNGTGLQCTLLFFFLFFFSLLYRHSSPICAVPDSLCNVWWGPANEDVKHY